MSNRRRANNRGRSRANKTNLDDLDGALSGMIGGQDKLAVAPISGDEHRFTMHSSNIHNDNSSSRGRVFSDSLKNEPIDLSGCEATQTPTFEKHQVNYSATKYIKP
jgi:hypothetical protein